MEYKELVKHHTQLIKDQNQNKWEVIETSDLEEICEAYHQAKLKLLGKDTVVWRSEYLVICKKCGSSEMYQYTKTKDKCEECGNIQYY